MLKDLILDSKKPFFFFEYLKKQGYSRQLVHKYVQNGWLEKVANGVYKKKGAEIDPLIIIQAVQEQLGLSFLVGGQSALQIHGISHFGRVNIKYIVLIPPKKRVKTWLKTVSELKFITMKLFKNNSRGVSQEKSGLKVSSKERALLEMAELVPAFADYDEFQKNMELAVSLRYELVQELLEDCLSVKAKRLFLFAAEKYNYSWFAKLNTKKISIGSGPRQIVKDGVYNSKYQIYVPELRNE